VVEVEQLEAMEVLEEDQEQGAILMLGELEILHL
jgi:succinyl-CoA synthetase alpha subunit